MPDSMQFIILSKSLILNAIPRENPCGIYKNIVGGGYMHEFKRYANECCSMRHLKSRNENMSAHNSARDMMESK